MADEVTRQVVLSRIDELVRAIDDAKPQMVAATTLDGTRRHAAASMLMRAVELLAAAVAIEALPDARPALELTLRSTFEVTTRGRYLLTAPKAEDEFVRMCRDGDRRDHELSAKTGSDYPGLPEWLDELLPETSKGPRNFWQICEGLDAVEGRALADRYSARSGYLIFYSWLSNSAVHAGMSAMKRFAIEDRGALRLVPEPEPLTSHWPVPVLASHVGELALRVFTAFDVDDSVLQATGVRLPTDDELS